MLNTLPGPVNNIQNPWCSRTWLCEVLCLSNNQDWMGVQSRPCAKHSGAKWLSNTGQVLTNMKHGRQVRLGLKLCRSLGKSNSNNKINRSSSRSRSSNISGNNNNRTRHVQSRLHSTGSFELKVLVGIRMACLWRNHESTNTAARLSLYCLCGCSETWVRDLGSGFVRLMIQILHYP